MVPSLLFLQCKADSSWICHIHYVQSCIFDFQENGCKNIYKGTGSKLGKTELLHQDNFMENL